MLSPRRPTLLPECRMCMSWFCASQIRSGHCRCRCPSPFLGNVSRLRSVHVPSHPPPTRTPVLRLPFFPSPDHHASFPESFQSSGLPPTFREHPRGLFFTLTPTACPSFQPNGESRLRLGVPIFPLGVPEAVLVVTRIHSVHAVEEGEPIRHFRSLWESRLVCAHWCHRDIRMTRMGSLLLAPT